MSAELTAKKAEVNLARDRVEADVEALLQALAPASLVRDGIDEAKAKAREIADDAAEFVKDRPVGTGAVIGSAAALGIWKLVSMFRETRKAKKR